MPAMIENPSYKARERLRLTAEQVKVVHAMILEGQKLEDGGVKIPQSVLFGNVPNDDDLDRLFDKGVIEDYYGVGFYRLHPETADAVRDLFGSN